MQADAWTTPAVGRSGRGSCHACRCCRARLPWRPLTPKSRPGLLRPASMSRCSLIWHRCSGRQVSARHLRGIQQDQLLAGELSAMGGYCLLRKLLPQLATEAAAAATAAGSDKQASSPSAAVGPASSAVLAGLLSLPGLGYQVLDSSDADMLLQLLALHAWDCSQLAAALAACLPCLGQHAPSE